MTRKQPPWDRLKELAAQRRDAHAQRLCALSRDRDEAQQRLEMLVSYRTDYQSRLTQSSSQGIDLTVLRNYQSFLSQLERAIAQQSDIVAQAERNVQSARSQWSVEHQRVESFQTLDDRHVAHAAREEQRRAQKLTDEWTTRSGVRVPNAAPDTEF
jgi:flagellar FliJ protein